MKKIIFTIAFIATGLVASAQVGVGTTNPLVSLQVDKSALAAEADGVLVPRVSVADLNAKTDAYVGAQNGALVFINDLTGTAAGKTSNVTATGFHYYESASDKWVSLKSPASSPQRYENIRGTVNTITANHTVLPSDHFIVTNAAAGITITFPNLTAADAGRVVYVYNNNTTASGNTVSNVTGQNSLNQFRGYASVWTGEFWFAIAK